jgi:hypothetical protein
MGIRAEYRQDSRLTQSRSPLSLRARAGSAAGISCLYSVPAALIWGSQLVMWGAGITVGLDSFDVPAIRPATGLATWP